MIESFSVDGASIEKQQELISSEGDETLRSVRYFLHGTNSLVDAEHIQASGLTAREGRATLSTDLEHAIAWARGEKRQYSESQTSRNENEVGKVFVLKKPSDYRVDYGLYTNAVVGDRQVTGSPVKFASARKQLALYKPESQADDLRRVPKEGRDRITLPPEDIEAVIQPSEGLTDLVSDLSTHARHFERFSIEDYSTRLAQILKNDPGNRISGDVTDISRELVTTTVESVVISRVRNLLLDVLSVKGYEIIENNEPQHRQKSLAILRQTLSELYDRCNQPGFDLGVEWLNSMVTKKTRELLADIGPA